MFARLSTLINIHHIDGSIIYTKDQRTLLIFRIETIALDDTSPVFEKFIELAEEEIVLLVMKKRMRQEDYKSYLDNIVEKNLHTKFLPQAMHFVERFISFIPSCEGYEIYCIVPVNRLEMAYWLHIFDIVQVAVSMLKEKEIYFLIQNIFTSKNEIS